MEHAPGNSRRLERHGPCAQGSDSGGFSDYPAKAIIVEIFQVWLPTTKERIII